MIEAMLGAAAAALIAKALDRVEDKAVDQGEGALQHLVERVRARLSGVSDEVLEKVEEVPDSRSRVEALEKVLDVQIEGDSDFRSELSALVEEAEGAGVDVRSAIQIAYGSQSPQFQKIYDSQINVNYGIQKAAPERLRRISD